MGFEANNIEYDYEFSCPNCGSDKVTVEENQGSLSITLCKKCGYKKPQQKS
jgi:predicted RNA-binding Zn-ribbon protein involved in translation (DUF1610 family)